MNEPRRGVVRPPAPRAAGFSFAAEQSALWSASTVGMVAHAADGRIVQCNGASEQLLGLTSSRTRTGSGGTTS